VQTEFRLIKIYDLPDYHEPAGGKRSVSLCGNQEVGGSVAVMGSHGAILTSAIPVTVQSHNATGLAPFNSHLKYTVNPLKTKLV
jgi:hypothetical protein